MLSPFIKEWLQTTLLASSCHPLSEVTLSWIIWSKVFRLWRNGGIFLRLRPWCLGIKFNIDFKINYSQLCAISLLSLFCQYTKGGYSLLSNYQLRTIKNYNYIGRISIPVTVFVGNDKSFNADESHSFFLSSSVLDDLLNFH